MEPKAKAKVQVLDFSSLKDALETLLVNEKKHSIVHHILREEEGVGIHTEKVGEWVIIPEGKFTLTLGNKAGALDLQQDVTGSRVAAFFIPVGMKHSLQAHSWLSYFVVKEMQ